MTIKKKMILLVSSAIIGMFILGGLGQYQILEVYDKANYGNENSIPSILAIDEGYIAVSNLRALLWQHVTQSEQKTMDEIEEKISINRKKVDDALLKYEPLLSNEKDR